MTAYLFMKALLALEIHMKNSNYFYLTGTLFNIMASFLLQYFGDSTNTIFGLIMSASFCKWERGSCGIRTQGTASSWSCRQPSGWRTSSPASRQTQRSDFWTEKMIFFINWVLRILTSNAVIIIIGSSVIRKKLPNVYKSCPKMISLEKDRFWHLYKNCVKMWEIWENKLLPKALKTCPESNKSPNLVTLIGSDIVSTWNPAISIL